MGDSVQDVYAKNLPTEFGYPLRIPEPSRNLPESYQENGLQIGDVGYVDRHGGFHVLFNIRYSSNHALHRKHGPPAGFEPIQFDDEQINVNPDSMSSGQFIGSPHIRHKPPERPDERLLYRFVPSLPSGAILILPFGAVEHELNEDQIENFRNIAVEQAQSWCAEARRDSVYLITGFHKARSWSLGSFNNAPIDGEILVRQPNDHDETAKIHQWAPNFSMYWRAGPKDTQSSNLNQTVFITGFKVTVRWWLPIPYVELLQRPSSTLFILIRLCMMFLLRTLKMLWRHISLKRHEHVPKLTPPFHPSDVINRYLLEKNPDAQLAVTHDRQWMSVLKMDELIHDGITNEAYAWEVLSDRYISASDNGAVWLESKNSSNDNFVTGSGDAHKPLPKLDGFSLRTASINNPWIVISRIRADNVIVDLKRIPLAVGFYVVAQFNDIRRKTKTRSIAVCESVIEWDDQIILSDDLSVGVQFSFCAVFEFDPMLGNGVTLHTSHVTVGDLVGNTSLINFSSGKAQSRPSLLIIAERRYFPHFEIYSSHDENDFGQGKSSFMACETDIGHEALLRYHQDYRAEDLKQAIEHFECALRVCPLDDECRPSALVNLAIAKFNSYEAGGRDTEISESIALYSEALEMRDAPHPNRPATLLGLSQTLLCYYQSQSHKQSLTDDVEKLMNAAKETCPEGSHERRAATLTLERFKWIRVIDHGTFSQLNELISELDTLLRVGPSDYFNQPYRLENLGLALRKRFSIQGDLDQLDRAIACQEHAVWLLHERSTDRARQLHNLGCTLYTRFTSLGDLYDLSRAIITAEEVLRLTVEDHPVRIERLENIIEYLEARFHILGDMDDLDQAIARREEAMWLTPENHPVYATRLHSLGEALCLRFYHKWKDPILDPEEALQEEAFCPRYYHKCKDHALDSEDATSTPLFQGSCCTCLDDNDRAIAMYQRAIWLTPEDHPAFPWRVVSLLAARDLQRLVLTAVQVTLGQPADPTPSGSLSLQDPH